MEKYTVFAYNSYRMG